MLSMAVALFRTIEAHPPAFTLKSSYMCSTKSSCACRTKCPYVCSTESFRICCSQCPCVRPQVDEVVASFTELEIKLTLYAAPSHSICAAPSRPVYAAPSHSG
jgi:hypothetical protein